MGPGEGAVPGDVGEGTSIFGVVPGVSAGGSVGWPGWDGVRTVETVPQLTRVKQAFFIVENGRLRDPS